MGVRSSEISPRMLSQEQAASYCGVSVPTFTSECPVQAVRMRHRVLYDRQLIDRWLDSLSGGGDEIFNEKDWLRRLDDAHAS